MSMSLNHSEVVSNLKKKGSMSKKAKIKEAEYFFSRMKEEQENKAHFNFNLSAFLTATRSVLQYAEKEAKAKKGGQQWYGIHMKKSRVLKYFRCKRNFNIHTAPIDPRTDHTIKIEEPVYVKDLKPRVTLGEGEKTKSKDSSEMPKPEPKKTKSTLESGSVHRFKDWPGNGDIIPLCEIYIQELKKVVQDGIRKGFITE